MYQVNVQTVLGAKPAPRYPVIKNRLAIISWLSPYMSDPTWEFEVNAVELNDQAIPTRMGKGHAIPLLPQMYAFVWKIQSADAASLVLRPGHLRINKHYVGDGTNEEDKDPIPMVECISEGFGNFVEIIQTIKNSTGVWHEVRALRWDDPMTYSPAEVNGLTTPTLVHKETCRTKENHIVNPGDGKDCYFPLLKREPHLWIHDSFVELFPELPAVVTYQGRMLAGNGYALYGASVYLHTPEMDVPLRVALRPGHLAHPCPEWMLKTGTVVPPVWRVS
jgi:hypothetical protein